MGGGNAGKKCGGGKAGQAAGCGGGAPSPSPPCTTAKLVGEEKKIKFLFCNPILYLYTAYWLQYEVSKRNN